MDDEDFDLNEFGQYEFDFESIWSDADSQCRAWHRELLKACQNDEIEEQNRIAKTLKECIEDQNDIQAKALLFMTVVTSNTQLLKVLTERLPDLCLRVKSDKNNNILHFACCCKQTDSAVQSLQIIWDKCGQQLIKEPNAEMRTPLHISAQNSQNPDLLRWLASTVKDKQQFFIKDNDGKSAVHVAFEYQDLETLQTLATELSLKNCLSVKCQGRQILHITAMISEDPSVLLWLVAKVEDKQRFFDPDEDGKSAVYVAFNYQELDTLQALTTELGLQSCVSAKGPRRRTISHAAAENRSIPSVLLWLVSEVEDKQRFFDPDEDRESAIHVAFSCLNLDTLQTLAKELGLKKCISVKGPRNRTILHAAAENSEDPSVFLWLVSELEEKQRFFDPDEDRQSAEMAIELNLLKCVSSKGPRNRTILHAAAENSEDPSVLLWLVSEVEDKQRFFDPDEDRESAIHVAFRCQNSDTLQELATELGLKKCLSAKGPMRRTILHAASENGSDPSVLLWLVSEVEGKQQFFDPDEDGESAVYVAFSCQNSDALQELAIELDLRKKKNDKKTEHDVERMSKTEESPEVQMLFRAFELDSTEMLRSLIGLGLVNDEIYDQFSKHILAQISKKQPNAKSPIMTTLLQYFSVQDGNSKALVLMEYAVLLEKPKLLTDLMLLPQFDIIPQTLRLLTYLKTKVDKSEILQRVQLQAYNTIINILDHLYANADEDTRELLFTYLTGSFRVSEDQRNAGPRFLAPHSSLLRRESSHADNDKPQQKRSNEARKLSSENDTASQKFKSVMDLVETLDCDDLFATECISNLVEQHWKRHPPLSWSRPQRCCTCNISAKVTIQQRFIIYSIFFLVFLLYFAWYVTDFSRTQQSPVPDIILLLYALSFTLQEVNDFINSISLKDLTILGRDMRIPRYFIDLFNYFDMAGLLLMWAGLVLKLLGHLSDPSLLRSCQVVLSVSFLFLGFRSVALLSYFKVTGPKINMLKSLLFSDLVPFMLVLLVLVYSFGIFFFNLLFPAFSDSRDAQALTKIFTVPVSLAFGMVESAQFESCSSSSLATGESCADEAGNKAYNGILVFVYLLLVNIVMWNLLIALFSRTVTELASRAEVLWRRNLFELLQEFAEVSPVPPPLSFPHYAWKLLQRCHACRCQPRSGEVSPADGAESSKPWWQHTEDFSGYPKDFKRFLIYQSEQLREHRPRLQWPVERNKGDIDVLKAHVENQVKDLLATQREDNEKMDERLDKLQQQMTNVMSILQQMQQQRQQ
uniref:ANK_REP_REGION domain-containing protein n=1 Tax=Macrostomum lignano TaxID=282301 RepID=A0A1I8G743_9PLAT